MAEIVFAWLQEHKEKLLFGFVLLVTALIALQAPVGGASLERIDAETRAKATSAAGLSAEEGERLIKRSRENEVQRVLEVPEAKISVLFFDDRSGYKSSRPSAWQLGSESFERLPPLLLGFPAFPGLNDFDMPAGAAPAPDRVVGYVPRDARKVVLTPAETSEFGPGG